MKKLMSLLLAAAMIIGMMPTIVLPASAEDKLDLNRWMEYLPDSIPISEINMPGTHDTATAFMGKAQGAASCQTMTIPEQLKNGMRMLDIRVDGEWGFTNEYERAMEMTVNHNGFNASVSDGKFSDYMIFRHVLEYTEKFLKDNPTETVVLYVSAEGGDSDLAKSILYNFVNDYHYTAKSAPCSEGEWIYKFVRCYKPGDKVPKLGEVRGKAVMILDNGGIEDAHIPDMRTVTDYEMAYKYEKHLSSDITKKVERIQSVISDANNSEWLIRENPKDFEKWPVFHREDYENQRKMGNPDVKQSGTNVTEVDGVVSSLAPNYKKPKECAELFFDALKKTDFLNTIITGYRYGWITMDFPEMYPELTKTIIQSNYAKTVYKSAVYISGIPEVDKEEIVFDINSAYGTPRIVYTCKEGTDKVTDVMLDFPTQWEVEKADPEHDYVMAVSVHKDGRDYFGILDELTPDPDTVISYSFGARMCEAKGYITLKSAPKTVEAKVRIEFEDPADLDPNRPRTLEEFIECFGYLTWFGENYGSEGHVVYKTTYTPEIAAEGSFLSSCLTGYTQVEGNENVYTLTARFPAYSDGGCQKYGLQSFEKVPTYCPYRYEVNNDEITLKLRSTGEVVPYLAYNPETDTFDQRYCNDFKKLSAGDLALKDGWYYVEGNIQSIQGYGVVGDVKLILADDCNLSVPQTRQPFVVSDGNSLTIYAQSTGEHMGSINAAARSRSAAIGGYDGESCGEITIHGGKINASGGFGAAGIGGGFYGSGGVITIYGGEIHAVGGENAPGIGGGEYGKGSNITVYGGTITAAAGGHFERAIGCGLRASDNGKFTVADGYTLRDNTTGELILRTFDEKPWLEILDGANISVSVEALTKDPVRLLYFDESARMYRNGTCERYKTINVNSRVLTKGWYVLNESGTIEDITVVGDVHLILMDNCTLTVAKGIHVDEGFRLSIYGQSEPSRDGNVMGKLISGLNKRSFTGAAIGGHKDEDCGIIKIHGGTIIANGSIGSAGIGGGRKGSGGIITIYGGDVTATGGNYAAGIGGGEGGSGGIITIAKSGWFGGTAADSEVDLPVIEAMGATVTAIGGDCGAGIGSGDKGNTGEITIAGGKVTATGGEYSAGVGAGADGSGGSIKITGGTVNAAGEYEAAGVGAVGANVKISGGNVHAIGGEYGDGVQASEFVVSPTSGYDIRVRTENQEELDGSPFAAETDITEKVSHHREVHTKEIVHICTVAFEMNGHGTQIEPQRVVKDKKAAKPEDPSEDGWIFGGWFADEDFKTEFDFGTEIIRDTTIYAKWLAAVTGIEVTTPPDKATYTVGERFDAAGMVVTAAYGDGTTKAVTDYTVTPDGPLTKDDTKVTISYAENGVTKTAEVNITVNTAAYTVRFDMGGHGTQVEPQTVESGSTATRPEDPTESGWSFGGWYVDAEFTTAFDFSALITGNTTVYAKWLHDIAEIKITTPPDKTTYVEGERFDGTGMVVTVIYGDGTTEDVTDYTVTPDRALTKDDTSVTISYSEGGEPQTVVQPITVNAAGYTVRFDMGGHGTQVEPQTVESGGTATRPEDPTEDGWIFSGWFADEECTTEYDFSAAITGDTTVYAKWTEVETYTVTVLVNDDTMGFAAASHSTAEAGTTIELTASANDGYHFVRWDCDDAEISSDSFTMPARNVTVTAVFDEDLPVPDDYAIVVTVNDGTMGAAYASEKRAKPGTVIYLTQVANDGYHFAVWESDEVDASTGAFTMPEQDVTVMAIFEENEPDPESYSITVEVNDGSLGTAYASAETAEEGTTIYLTANAKAGGYFDYWDSDEVEIIDGCFEMPDCDVTVYAMFAAGEPEPGFYTITVKSNDRTMGTASASLYTAEEGELIALTANPKEGYQFVRWETEDVDISDNMFEMPARNVAIKAVFKAIPVDYAIIEGADGEWTKETTDGLTFVSNAPYDKFESVKVDGSTIASSKYQAEEGSTRITLTPGFLQGLSTGSHSIEIVSSNGSASTNFTVKPAPTYKVSFDMGGHGTQVPSQTVEEGKKAKQPAKPTASGYSFSGWYVDSSYSKLFNFNSAIEEDTIVYAKWAKKSSPTPSPTPTPTPVTTTYTVSFLMIGHGEQVPSQTVRSGSKATKPADPTDSGWKFEGWYTDPLFTKAFDFGTAIRSTTILYAKWTKEEPVPTEAAVTYTVNFDMGGHGKQVPAMSVEEGSAAVQPEDPTAAGWIFEGWYVDEDYTEEFDFDTEINEDITVYAKWEEIPEEVTEAPELPEEESNPICWLWWLLLIAGAMVLAGIIFILCRRKRKEK